MKPPEYYRGKEQTYLKHFFFEQYLETVAFHIGYAHPEFVYVDCFSGPWRADDENLADTSIRIALERLNYARNGLAKQQRYPRIKAIFVEKTPSAFSDLQQALEQYRGDVKAIAFPGTFVENIPNILKEIRNTFAFFFIDPTGWTGLDMDQLRPILRHDPGEVMVNFMYDFINRFLNEANEKSLDPFFGTTEWRTASRAADREDAIVSLYMQQIRSVGNFSYATSTRILKPLQDRAYFHLIYATRSAKGVLKFRDIEKRLFSAQEDVRAKAKREDREQRTKQTELTFDTRGPLLNTRREERLRQLKKAEERIYALLQVGPIRYEALQPLILELPLVWNTDLTELPGEGQKNRRLIIDGLGPRQRAPKAGCIVRLAERTSKRQS